MKPEPTPWSTLIAAAHSIGVRPADFWRLSLKEWRALVAPSAGGALTSAAFDALTRRFPDKS